MFLIQSNMQEELSHKDEIEIKNENGELIKVKVYHLRYIEYIDKDTKKVVLISQPELKEMPREILWKTRLSLEEIINFLVSIKGEVLRFVQINSKIIARSLYISGRDSKWEYIQLSDAYNNLIYKPKEFKIGRKYIPQIKKIISLLVRIEIENSFKGDCPDIIFVNPLDVICIEINKQTKIVFLSKPFLIANKLCFEVNWNTRLSANEIINQFSEFLIQVNRKLLVCVSHIVEDNILTSNSLELRMLDKSIKTIQVTKVYIKKIMN
jgi:hypothetical protein